MKKYKVKNMELDIKRFYLPIKFNKKCPNCGSKIEFNLSEDYISYPVVGESESLYGYCDNCEGEFNVDVKLNVSLSVNDNLYPA